MTDSQKQRILEMENRLFKGLSVERLERIQANIVQLSESELTT